MWKVFRNLGSFGDLPKRPVRFGGCNQAYCGIWKVRENMTPKSPLVVGAWRAQVHRVG